MKKLDWKQKLSSRKFWCAVAGFVTALLMAFNVNDLTVEKVTVIIAAIGTLAVYIIGESYIDAKSMEAVAPDDVEKTNDKTN